MKKNINNQNSQVYTWMKEWVNLINNNDDNWLEIENVGKFKELNFSDENSVDNKVKFTYKSVIWDKKILRIEKIKKILNKL